MVTEVLLHMLSWCIGSVSFALQRIRVDFDAKRLYADYCQLITSLSLVCREWRDAVATLKKHFCHDLTGVNPVSVFANRWDSRWPHVDTVFMFASGLIPAIPCRRLCVFA